MMAKRAERQAQADEAANTLEAVARQWLAKTVARRAPMTHSPMVTLLENDIFPYLGSTPITRIKGKDILDKAILKIEARGAIHSADKAMQHCGQIFRYAVATGFAGRDITTDIRGALAATPTAHFAAITKPDQAAALMRSINGYAGYTCTVAALKLTPLVFVRPGELRTMEWKEVDFKLAEWRIPAEKMKMKVEHLVPLSKQAIEILKSIQAITGHGRYVFPSIRTGERPMSDNTINAALRGMGYPKEVHTAHGFRAIDLQSVAQRRAFGYTDYPRDVSQMVLAHIKRTPYPFTVVSVHI